MPASPNSILRSGVAAVFFLSASACAVAPALAETIGGALAKAYVNNSELNSARAGVRVTDENVAIAKSGWRPTITGQSNIDYTSQRGNRLTTGSFGVEIQQLLFDGFRTRNNVLTAEAQVEASNESLRNTEQNILFNAASSYMDVIRDRQIAILRARNLEFLEEQVRAARSRFEVGEGTRTDVAQAEASRSSAVAQLAAARAQAESSAATYHQIVGEDPGKLSSPSAAKGLPRGSTRPSRSPMSSIRRSLRPSTWSMPPALPSSRRKARCCRRFRPTPTWRATTPTRFPNPSSPITAPSIRRASACN